MQANHTSAQRFTELCTPYSPMVYRHCLHLLKKPQDAEDAAQETMLRAFRAFEKHRGDGVASWLFRIAHNTCLDILKSARVQREATTLDEWREIHGDPCDPTGSPEEHYERSAAQNALWEATLTLSTEQQTLLSLCYGQNMSYEELAKATGMRVGTVKSRLNRAKTALREKLKGSE